LIVDVTRRYRSEPLSERNRDFATTEAGFWVADKLDTIAKSVPSGVSRLECGQLNKLIEEVLQKMRLNHLIAAFAVVHYDKAGPPRQ